MNDVLNAFGLFECIGDTSSRTDKEKFLKEGSSNEVLKRLLLETYNPFRTFNIKKDPKADPGTNYYEDESLSGRYRKFIMLLNMLHEREITGNEAINTVRSFFNTCTPIEYKWYLKVLQKDLKIGITDKTINKVFKGLVPTFSCMLAHPFKEYPTLPKRVIYDPKLDGYRCLLFVYEDGHVELRTRNGNLIEGYDNIEVDGANLLKGYVYDGEIMGRDKSFNTVQKAVFKKGKNKDGVFNIFDMVTIKEFELGTGCVKYSDRIAKLEDVCGNTIYLSENLTLVPHSDILDGTDPVTEQLLLDAHTKFKAEGFEGTMVKDADAVYQCKRTRAVLKVKDMDTLDLTVVAVEEGEPGTKYEGVLGALVVEYEGNTVNVGSGYTDAQRTDFWNRRNDLINRTIEVQFQEVTTNKENKKSLRFPVFQGFRDDK